MRQTKMEFEIVTQADFIREYYPTGHAINDPAFYPDIYREEEETVYNENGDNTGEKDKAYIQGTRSTICFCFSADYYD